MQRNTNQENLSFSSLRLCASASLPPNSPCSTLDSSMEQPILIAGQWRPAHSIGIFSATNPATGERLPDSYPVSDWSDCDAALDAADATAKTLQQLGGEKIA